MRIANNESGTRIHPNAKVKNPASNQNNAQKAHQMIQKIRTLLCIRDSRGGDSGLRLARRSSRGTWSLQPLVRGTRVPSPALQGRSRDIDDDRLLRPLGRTVFGWGTTPGGGSARGEDSYMATRGVPVGANQRWNRGGARVVAQRPVQGARRRGRALPRRGAQRSPGV